MNLVLALLVSLTAHAEVVTCLDNHEDAAASKITASIQTGVTSLLKAKKITAKTIDIKGEVIVTDDSDQHNNTVSTYGMFQMQAGEIAAADGTKLSVDLSGGSFPDGTDVAFYEPVLKSSGFDNEGNPINAHCTLNFTEYAGYSNEATTVTVSNSGSGHVIGTFPLAKSISVY